MNTTLTRRILTAVVTAVLACAMIVMAPGCQKPDDDATACKCGEKCGGKCKGKKGACGCKKGPCGCRKGAVKTPVSAEFYGEDGAFKGDVSKQAYFDMMAAFNYPIPERLKGKEFWTADFVQADFAKLGMGGILWVNEANTYGGSGEKGYKGDFKDAKFGYLGHEIYLLPGQTLPEHRHVGGAEGYGPKMEAWHVRYGTVEFFGQHKGAGDETLISEMPADQRPWGFGQDWFKSVYIAKRKAGQMYKLVDPETWHGQRAGPNGAIVAEYATYHNQVEFSKPEMVFDSTKAKPAE